MLILDADALRVAAAGALLVALTLGPGTPWALVLDRSERGWGRVLAEAAVLGLGAMTLAGIVLARAGWFGPWTLAGAAGLIAAAGTVAARRTQVQLPPRRRPELVDVAAIAVLLGALALRLNPINFIFDTGDMGDYVNSANELVRGEDLIGGFPHLFTVYLSLTTAFLGPGATAAGVPWLGVLLVVGVLRLGAELGADRWGTVVVAAIVGVANLPVWFSVFPVSEALNAVLVLAGLVLAARIAREPSRTGVVLTGALGLLLGLLRGNALLLLPLAVLAAVPLGASAAPRARLQVGAVTALVGGIGLAALYNIRYLPAYFVDLQLATFVPGRIFDLLDDLGLLRLTPQAVVAVGAGTAATLGIGLGVGSLLARRGIRAAPAGQAAVALVVASTVLWAIASGTGELVPALERLGVLFILGGAAGAIIGLRSDRGPLVVVAAVATSVAVTFAALHAYRFPELRLHHYFQYWDRYLLSEVFPCLVALLLAGLAGGPSLLGSVGDRARRTRVLAVVPAVAVLAAPLASATELALDQELFGDPYGDIAHLDEVTSEPELPIIWSSSDPEVPPGWFFPNTFRAYATPLARTFQRDVLNLPGGSFDPDPVVTPRAAALLLEEAGEEGAYLIEVVDSGPPFDTLAVPADLSITLVEERTVIVPILPQTGGPRWRHQAVVQRVYRLQLDPAG